MFITTTRPRINKRYLLTTVAMFYRTVFTERYKTAEAAKIIQHFKTKSSKPYEQKIDQW